MKKFNSEGLLYVYKTYKVIKLYWHVSFYNSYYYIYIYIPIWQNIKVNHRFINQIKHPVVRYKTCCRHRLQENNAYLLQSEDRKVGEATDINKGFVFREIY